MKPRFSIQQHLATGAFVSETRDSFLHLSTKLSNHYPVNSKQCRLAEKALNGVESLQCYLEDVMFSEFPQISHEGVRIYYPGRPQSSDIASAEELATKLAGIATPGKDPNRDREISQAVIEAFSHHKVEIIRKGIALFNESNQGETL